ncbi:Protein of unknown function [Arboricoccus pini]|uniref:DUF2735 domain-containing protein n=1 Tax=Arboricoccus pini TaxID=1963835 RepID=A0A212S0F7_9PROT|nr:DUF2735 domain-containing protein [Arboricoccus pini]SNB78625.1 Protein of unknown function [Arboricoccus pini]
MMTNPPRRSAEIYQFPARGRSLEATRREAAQNMVRDLPAMNSKIVYGGGWYHEEAIREAENRRRR